MTAEWSPELTLNHDLLDGQHVELFRLLRDAAAAVERGGTLGISLAVTAFSDALIEHLAAEEEIMEETLYPERARHKSAHDMFVSDLVRMRAELEAHGPTGEVAAWFGTRAPEWLRFHIRVNDGPLGAHLARRRAAGFDLRRLRDERRHRS